MKFRGKTTKQAISRAVNFGHTQNLEMRRKRCDQLSNEFRDAEQKFANLESELLRLSALLDEANRQSSNNNIDAARDVGELITGLRRYRRLLRLLENLRRGRIGNNTIKELKDVLNFLEDIQDVLEAAKRATRDVDNWTDIQSQIGRVNRLRRPIWDHMQRLYRQFIELDCINLEDPDTQMS